VTTQLGWPRIEAVTILADRRGGSILGGRPLTYIVVLFNLKADALPQAYEDWARSTDIPNVRALTSNAGFDVFKLLSVRGSGAAPPHQYMELISIADMDQFGIDVSADTMKKVAAEFRGFADNPTFILAEKIEP
jgi:hypothetical protein